MRGTMRGKTRLLALALAITGALLPFATYAASTPTLNQTLNQGRSEHGYTAN